MLSEIKTEYYMGKRTGPAYTVTAISVTGATLASASRRISADCPSASAIEAATAEVEQRLEDLGLHSEVSMAKEVNPFGYDEPVWLVRSPSGQWWRDTAREAYGIARSQIRLLRADRTNEHVSNKLPWIRYAVEV